ncbi:hypothetical protein ACFPPA_05130 [Rhodanobacter ginsengisoli]|uniref:Lipoprotein n=1 Tax=Rhodanobacter ginsengisoli TaxID=418646 RepID=A0ABW0QJV9_9GAMM
MITLSRLALATTIAGLLLTGCAEHPAARSTKVSTSSATVTTTETGTVHRQHSVASGSRTATEANLPDRTGIPACDDYLSSYLACHRAAAIYAPDQLQYRYQAMRTSLLRDSRNPDIRPQLGARCNSLATQLRQALHGKSCAENPAPAASTP